MNAFAARRQKERAERRERANQRTTQAVEKRADREHEPAVSLSFIALALLASFAVHGGFLLLARIMPQSFPAKRRTFDQAVQVRMAPPKPAPPPPEPPKETAPEPTTKPTVTPKIAPKIEEPPKDPTDFKEPDKTPDPPKDEQPKRRVIGLNLESTTTTSGGGAYATGNTRMGETLQVAEDPHSAGKLASSFVPPKRTTAPKPVYPPALRSANVEGDVGLRVEIDASGNVTNVTVLSPSGHPEMDRAAVDSARASRYEPAKLNGVAVGHAIEFTVRFRLER